MTVDLDTANDINEKLNGLVNLLQIVGIDGVDASALVAESKRKSGGSTSTTKTAGSSDSQILELVKKLQQAQEESPELLEALKIPELRALATLAAQKKGNAPAPAPAASLDDVMDDDDDNYPKIGPGYSDDISVVSDLTTPTVMTKQNIADEEYYRDVNGGPSSGPPIHIGGPSRLPMAIGAGTRKSKNMLNNVSAAKAGRAIGKAAAGGAAAQRRELQKQIQAKLQGSPRSPRLKTPKTPRSKPRSSPEEKRYMDAFDTSKRQTFSTSTRSSKKPMDPMDFPSMSEHSTRRKSSRKSDPTRKKSGRKSKSSRNSGDNIDWGGGGDFEWPKFDKFDQKGVENFADDPFSPSSEKSKIDSDGFFASDPFADYDPFATGRSSHGSSTKKKKKKSRDDGQGTRTRREKDPNRKSRRQRRASMEM